MVAAILLIAFTVAVGGLISVWLTSYSRTTTSAVESTTTNQTKCAGAYIKVDSVTSSLIIYSNPSTQTITNLNITTGDGRFVTPNPTSLSPGGMGTASWSRGSNTSVLMKGLCLVTVSAEGSCESGQLCWSS